MSRTRLAILLLSSSILTAGTGQADQAILIGGGYNVNSSQGQIELNVNWVQDVLNRAGLPVTTFFTDGNDPAPDVHYTHIEKKGVEPKAIDQLAQQLEPVSRLFGSEHANQRRHRNHSIANVKAGTNADSLSTALDEMLSNAPDEPTLIVYNGHGRQSQSNAAQVTMELWGDSQLTAAQLHGVLDASNAPNRFVFTQCYSGGFHRLAYDNPESGLKLSSNTRCGFTAESAYRLAEGCSASIDTADYRDYTTYFFAALDGYDRNGEILPVDTDMDNDGEVSMREAHLYTLEYAHSTDLSRSTSEDYLNTWQPWYLKWNASSSALPSNEYAKLYRSLASKHDITLGPKSAKQIRAKMQSYKDTTNNLTSRRAEIQQELFNIQQALVYDTQNLWPALTNPYTAMFQTMVASGEMMQVANWITEQPDYKSILELQNEDEKIVTELLDTERNLTQMQKLFEFRKLANLKHQIYQYGSTEEIRDYEGLVSCEDTPLNFSTQ